MKENSYQEYISPITGKVRRDTWYASHITRETLRFATLGFVTALIEDEGEEYLHGVMKNPVKMVFDGKLVCKWSPKDHTWIDYV